MIERRKIRLRRRRRECAAHTRRGPGYLAAEGTAVSSSGRLLRAPDLGLPVGLPTGELAARASASSHVCVEMNNGGASRIAAERTVDSGKAYDCTRGFAEAFSWLPALYFPVLLLLLLQDAAPRTFWGAGRAGRRRARACYCCIECTAAATTRATTRRAPRSDPEYEAAAFLEARGAGLRRDAEAGLSRGLGRRVSGREASFSCCGSVSNILYIARYIFRQPHGRLDSSPRARRVVSTSSGRACASSTLRSSLSALTRPYTLLTILCKAVETIAMDRYCSKPAAGRAMGCVSASASTWRAGRSQYRRREATRAGTVDRRARRTISAHAVQTRRRSGSDKFGGILRAQLSGRLWDLLAGGLGRV